MRILLLDIETAPHKVYAWGMFKQDIYNDQIQEAGYTLCFAAKWYGQDDILFSSVHKDGRKLMVQKAYQLIDEADAIIHYNGTKFDIPILYQEFLAEGYRAPSPHLDIDLLRTARRRFRLPRNNLDYVARYLGLGKKVKHKGMELWRECMDGDDAAWEVMKKYNIQDVNLLEQVYERLKGWIPNHPNVGLFADGPPVQRCPNCGSVHLHKRGHYHTQTMSYQRFNCQTCGAWSRERTNDVPLEKRKVILKGII